MPRGALIENGVRRIILHMHESLELSASQIVHYTSVPQQTVYRVLKVHRRLEETQKQVIEMRGRPRKLDFADTQVCSTQSA